MIRVRVDGGDIAHSRYQASKILLDTNLLVFANHKGSPFHEKASCILIASLQGDLKACISSQNLLEFYSVMTNPSRVKPAPSISEISRICSDLWKSNKIKKIYPHENAALEAIEIAKEKGMRGPKIFDCLLAATMKKNRIDRIWTDNVSDLKHFDDLLVVVENPLEMEWEISGQKDHFEQAS